MTAVTIVSGNSSGSTGTFVFYGGEVKACDDNTEANIEQESLPFGLPTDAYVFDYNGPTTIVTITGILFNTSSTRVSGQSVSTKEQQAAWLKNVINGSQIANHQFSSNNHSSVNILAGRFNFRENAGRPNALDFTMILLVGTAT